MFVSDTNIFPSSALKIRISCPDGTDIFASFLPESTVDNLKVAILGNILQDSALSLKESLYYKVVLVRTLRSLEDDKTLLEQGVEDNDEVILLKRRLMPSQFEKGGDKNKIEEGRKGPTSSEILAATSTMPFKDRLGGSEAAVSNSVDFQAELRKILISLIDVSQKLLCLNPEASKIFQQAEEILNEGSPPERVDEDSVRQLTDMGFSASRARKALSVNKMSVMSAMEWLLQHSEDSDIDSPAEDQGETCPELGAEGGSQVDRVSEDENSTESRVSEGRAHTESGLLEGGAHTESPCKVSNILQSLRAYRKREFKPNQKTLQSLVEMGFEETDCINALRSTRNDGDAACEMLINNKKPAPEEVDEGMDRESPLFRAIMSNPAVQLGLNNPRCLLAFIQMLEHPHTANQWLSDPETAPLLVHISRIYHAEKHSKQQQQHEEMVHKQSS
ncbi:ubiquitin-associated domain-containing protein 1-like [Mya arenaria]|uniref:ubiquitin-associated domain-containing protein 1-like n=1 Tax=Mya arenaria TaxID=6604 RepID=UPI0022E32D59|nr:ubiquitin-associated domain-containing protein 1-like [Mya arenaria]